MLRCKAHEFPIRMRFASSELVTAWLVSLGATLSISFLPLLLLPPLSRRHHPRPELLRQLCCSPLVPPIHPALSCQIHLFKSTALIMPISCHHMEAKGQGIGRRKALASRFTSLSSCAFWSFPAQKPQDKVFVVLQPPQDPPWPVPSLQM